MVTTHTIGEITLSVSTVIYVIWFIPQVWENYQRKSTQGLSLWMHGLLFLGYTLDLMYGFGRHMEWQYRLVTVSGLFFLMIQHIQFARYDLKSKAAFWNFFVITALVLSTLLYSILNLTIFHHGKLYYDMTGYIESACYFTYVFPQIIKNFRNHSTEGLSKLFVGFSILLSLLDFTSAMTLHWDLPSLLMPMMDMVKKMILVIQIIYYQNRASVCRTYESQ